MAADIPPTCASKSSYAHHRETRVFAANTPPSPPSPSGFGCACFLLPSDRRVKKQKQGEGEPRSSKIKAKIQQGRVQYDGGGSGSGSNDTNNEWQAIWNEETDSGGLFDVKSTEREFKRVSMKEKQLTQEAQKLLKMVPNS